jgi:hypothetical protein
MNHLKGSHIRRRRSILQCYALGLYPTVAAARSTLRSARLCADVRRTALRSFVDMVPRSLLATGNVVPSAIGVDDQTSTTRLDGLTAANTIFDSQYTDLLHSVINWHYYGARERDYRPSYDPTRSAWLERQW